MTLGHWAVHWIGGWRWATYGDNPCGCVIYLRGPLDITHWDAGCVCTSCNKHECICEDE